MYDIEFEDEADFNGETETIEVIAEGDVDQDLNVINLKITSIYVPSLNKTYTLKDLNFSDSKRIVELVEKEILNKNEEEGQINEIDVEDFVDSTSDDFAEIDKLVSKKQYYQH